MPFQEGNKAATKRKVRKGGAPKKADLKAKEDRLTVWQRELEKWDTRLAARFCEQAMVDNTVLLSARKSAIPDAKQEIGISGGLKIIKVNSFDPDDSK